MKAGDPVQQWMFENNGEYYYLWFAKVNYADEEPWRVTLTKNISAGFRHRPKIWLGDRYFIRFTLNELKLGSNRRSILL